MSDLEDTIRTLRGNVDGAVCSRSRVLDALLDVRLEAGARVDVVEVVDQALRDLPGKTMVPADWWVERLDAFEVAAINPVESVG